MHLDFETIRKLSRRRTDLIIFFPDHLDVLRAQIPYQLIKRYTKKQDIVLDLFLGSGTTLFECENLN
ncbi:MAG TPA: hypothetical protein ENJ06_06405, partial [Phycisphaeraceae bacterium]|nr:hypothetical protein [Phycisphaeraceae bacterium]